MNKSCTSSGTPRNTLTYDAPRRLSQSRRETRAAQTATPIRNPKTMPANETATVVAAASARYPNEWRMTSNFIGRRLKERRAPLLALKGRSDRRLGDRLGQVHRLPEPGLLDLRHRAVGLDLEDRGVDRIDERLVVEPADPGKIGRLAEWGRHDGERVGALLGRVSEVGERIDRGVDAAGGEIGVGLVVVDVFLDLDRLRQLGGERLELLEVKEYVDNN